MKRSDLVGKKFHHLEVLYLSDIDRTGHTRWMCKCDCGREKVVSADHLTRKSSPVISCGCKSIRAGSDNSQWTGYEEISGNWWYQHVTRERTQKYRDRVPVTITKEYAWGLFVKQDRKCALSGIELCISGTYQYNTASIDRIDSSKGYEIGNIQWVHKHVNFMKRTYSQEYFIKLCELICKHSGNSCEVK